MFPITFDGISLELPCYELKNHMRIAVCLLQLNLVKGFMECSGDGMDDHINSGIKDADADKFDLVPSDIDDNNDDDYDDDDYDDDDDDDDENHDPWRIVDNGRFTVTPRGVLLRAFNGCANTRTDKGGRLCGSNVVKQFQHCPYRNFQEFMVCLCCMNVVRDDFARLEVYLGTITIGDIRYSHTLADYSGLWTCKDTMCHDGDESYVPKALKDWRRRRNSSRQRRDEDENEEEEEEGEVSTTYTLNSYQKSFFAQTQTPQLLLPISAIDDLHTTYDLDFLAPTGIQFVEETLRPTSPVEFGEEEADGVS